MDIFLNSVNKSVNETVNKSINKSVNNPVTKIKVIVLLPVISLPHTCSWV